VSFWDSSALFPLAFNEPASPLLRAISEERGVPLVWWGAFVECWSALERRTRAARVSTAERQRAEQVLGEMAATWIEIHPSPLLRDRAVRLLAVHDLRAGEALQLAAALTWAEERPRGRAFICLDERLREAARREGFTVLPEKMIWPHFTPSAAPSQHPPPAPPRASIRSRVRRPPPPRRAR
jgi:predicted nucleic acid-binding protein